MLQQHTVDYCNYSKYSRSHKISYNKVSDKMAYANFADPDLTDLGLHCLPFTEYLKKKVHKKQNLGKTNMG